MVDAALSEFPDIFGRNPGIRDEKVNTRNTREAHQAVVPELGCISDNISFCRRPNHRLFDLCVKGIRCAVAVCEANPGGTEKGPIYMEASEISNSHRANERQAVVTDLAPNQQDIVIALR